MSSDEIVSNATDVATSVIGVAEAPTVGAATVSNSLVRNVQTQHGDYRSIDVENTFVLRLCYSPVPTRATIAEDGDDDGKGGSGSTDQPDPTLGTDEEQVVWIEPDFEVNSI